MASMHRVPRRRTRSIVLWALAAVVLVLILVVLWVAIRGLIARDQLLGAVPLAKNVTSAALGGDSSKVKADVAALQTRAQTAASLTSDPIWRAAEFVPVLGTNLRAFRQAAETIDQVASDALPPLTDLASTFTVDSFTPKNGSFDLQPFVSASPTLRRARIALDAADKQAMAIDTSDTVSQVGAGVDQIVDLVDQTRRTVDDLDTAAALLPSMLGASGTRNYLLLSLNNAELRATGGIPGAATVLTADNGKLSLGSHSSATALGEFSAPVLPLSASEIALYKRTLGTYLQDVNSTPDFARSGALAQAMWKERTGQTVDGVIAIDPVALSYILSATGPVNAGSGLSLTSTNAVQILLSEVYAKFSKPIDQDNFFAGVTAQVFQALTTKPVDSRALVNALSRASNEGRIHVWSSHADEQHELATASIAGSPPASDRKESGFGVYLNDSTGAKMDYYLTSAIGVASAVCRSDYRPNFEVRVSLTSTAPADAATSLPEYVTGGGAFGVDPGNIGTNVYVYAPAGALAYSATIDGREFSYVTAKDGDNSVAGVNVTIPPGKTVNVAFQFLGKAHQTAAVSLVHTPMASVTKSSIDNYLDCPSIQPDHTTTGALGGLINSRSVAQSYGVLPRFNKPAI